MSTTVKLRMSLDVEVDSENEAEAKEIQMSIRLHTEQWAEHLEAQLVERLRERVPGVKFRFDEDDDWK